MKYQYASTSGRYGKNGVSNPVVPNGELVWEMIGCSAADGLLFWFWRTEVAPAPEVEASYSA